MPPTMAAKFVLDGHVFCHKRLELISGRSWIILDNQVSFYHRCNVLTFEGRPSGFLAPKYNVLDREDDIGILKIFRFEGQ